MLHQVSTPQVNLEQLANEALSSRQISRVHQQLINTMVSQNLLASKDRILVDLILYGVRNGLISVVD